LIHPTTQAIDADLPCIVFFRTGWHRRQQTGSTHGVEIIAPTIAHPPVIDRFILARAETLYLSIRIDISPYSTTRRTTTADCINSSQTPGRWCIDRLRIDEGTGWAQIDEIACKEMVDTPVRGNDIDRIRSSGHGQLSGATDLVFEAGTPSAGRAPTCIKDQSWTDYTPIDCRTQFVWRGGGTMPGNRLLQLTLPSSFACRTVHLVSLQHLSQGALTQGAAVLPADVDDHAISDRMIACRQWPWRLVALFDQDQTASTRGRCGKTRVMTQSGNLHAVTLQTFQQGLARRGLHRFTIDANVTRRRHHQNRR
jgi:hypothetical protein